jgi:dihydrofolate synthase / folylpolyglutamate synthase
MNYVSLLKQLYACSLHGMKFGLENALKLNEAIGHPKDNLKTVHIAGTNGKGSVATKISKSLQASGLNVGLYTSPHISSFRERISINGQMISEEAVSRLLNDIFYICESKRIPATFFEITTLLCLKYFEEQNVDIAVIETGLGGRLDATNIITPLLSVITSISFDHTEILGNTIESITLEKAGIIKSKVPVIIGPRVPFPLISQIAQSQQSECLQVAGSFLDFEEENQAVAKRALEKLNVSAEAIAAGIKQMPACRLQLFEHQQLKNCLVKQHPKAVILDVAHNPDGLKHLFQALKRRYPNDKYRVVAALSSSKDIESCLKLIGSHADAIHLTEAPHPRAARVKDLEQTIPLSFPIAVNPNLEESITEALAEAASHHQILLICGTFFMMAAARKILGIEEASDPLLLTDFSKKM